MFKKTNLQILTFILLSYSSAFASSTVDTINVLKKFYFIRHGETDYNKHDKTCGSSDIPLNDTGKKQAAKAAPILRNEKIDIIIASPMLRAKETAEIIAKTINVPIIYDNEIREINWGSYEGKPSKTPEALNNFQKWRNGDDMKDTEAESKKVFQKRISIAVNDILSKHNNVLIVSHSGVFRSLTDIMGIGYTRTKNAIPYIFIPTGNQQPAFEVKKLG